jgi:hypothetical protein
MAMSLSHAKITNRVLKYVFVDTIYMNYIRVHTHIMKGPDYLLCYGIEEYMRFEQHCSNVVQLVREEDLSVENQSFSNIVLLHRISMV